MLRQTYLHCAPSPFLMQASLVRGKSISTLQTQRLASLLSLPQMGWRGICCFFLFRSWFKPLDLLYIWSIWTDSAQGACSTPLRRTCNTCCCYHRWWIWLPLKPARFVSRTLSTPVLNLVLILFYFMGVASIIHPDQQERCVSNKTGNK